MANVFPKRWTELLQVRVAPESLEDLDAVCNARGRSRSEVVRELISEEAARIAARAKTKRK